MTTLSSRPYRSHLNASGDLVIPKAHVQEFCAEAREAIAAVELLEEVKAERNLLNLRCQELLQKTMDLRGQVAALSEHLVAATNINDALSNENVRQGIELSKLSCEIMKNPIVSFEFNHPGITKDLA